MLDHLRAGEPLDDRDFDHIYPASIREVSDVYWTPVDVARKAALWMAEGGCRRVLDVGAGVGKFCLVGAAVAPEMTFVGIEHRPHLVAVAQQAARACALRNVLMLLGSMEVAPWRDCDAFYFYNPFDENNFSAGAQLDGTVELSTKRYMRDVYFVERCLRASAVGTRVVTYHGFGGAMPVEYVLEREEPRGVDFLRFWIKGQPSRRPARERFSHSICAA
ncbi:MAG: methyltransferase domain-containing protein [Myxococcota bacterium]